MVQLEIPISACQLGARDRPNRAGDVWNPSAFTGKGKQAGDQRQLVGLQTQVRQGEGGGGGGRQRGVPVK